ncbi:MAG: uroporphyrinogen decarboxylase [Myxococcota bacterium]
MANAIQDSLFLKACRRQPVERPPAWMMRQAGRYMQEYQEVRAEAGGFLQLCLNPPLAAKATLDAQRILGTDAAIIFSDITLPGQAMGLDLTFDPGPVFTNPPRSREDIAALKTVDPNRDLSAVMEAIDLTRKGLPDDVSLIGFCGAPFTLAGYMIEGRPGKNWIEMKRMLYGSRDVFNALIDRVVETVIAHARAQLEAGCDTVQLFDSNAGELAPPELKEVAFGATKRCVDALKGMGAPIIYFPRGAGSHLEAALEVGADVLAVDWTVDLADVTRRLGSSVALMGNLDPTALLADEDSVRRRTTQTMENARGASGYIFNLGHGILPPTPVPNAKAVIETVRAFRW